MKLGFVGTGEITSAMVTGLSADNRTSHSILVSPVIPQLPQILLSASQVCLWPPRTRMFSIIVKPS